LSIRTRIFGPGADDPLLPPKIRKGAKADALDSVAVRRAESRRGNSRNRDRHRLSAEYAVLRREGKEDVVELVNLSAGGAMLRGDLGLSLWDQVRLVLGEDGEMDCAVRWIKGRDIGLEFAAETRIDCGNDERDDLLRAVIRKSFPTLQSDPLGPEPSAEIEEESGYHRVAERHPLIWSGIIYHDYEVEPVRLRNISASGAMVQSAHELPVGATVFLEVASVLKLEATVRWTRGGQSGISFAEPFDVQTLSRARPEVAVDEGNTCEVFGHHEPYAPAWRRATIDQMARTLGG
jgi:PilZ domain.